MTFRRQDSVCFAENLVGIVSQFQGVGHQQDVDTVSLKWQGVRRAAKRTRAKRITHAYLMARLGQLEVRRHRQHITNLYQLVTSEPPLPSCWVKRGSAPGS